jgi:hypothetical protein
MYTVFQTTVHEEHTLLATLNVGYCFYITSIGHNIVYKLLLLSHYEVPEHVGYGGSPWFLGLSVGGGRVNGSPA